MDWETVVGLTAERAACSETDAKHLLAAFSCVICDLLEREDKAPLPPELGVLVVKEIGGEARSAVRSQITKTKRSVMFKASNDLKKRMRQSDEDYLAMLERLGAWKQVEQLRRAEAKKEYSA